MHRRRAGQAESVVEPNRSLWSPCARRLGLQRNRIDALGTVCKSRKDKGIA
ncbi:hypothetical protein BF49_6055 [Bradyrhizobium sp.]|nr:hypothetical protein BF49_6055 [Bradyrhizobium sp.]